MSRTCVLGVALLAATGCSKAKSGATPDAPCTSCDAAGNGLPDAGPTLEKTFPPYGLTFTPTGDLGRAGGLTWTYTGIARGSLTHIWWIFCDDPDSPCGLSLAGPIDRPTEAWVFDASRSDLSNGTLAFTDTAPLMLADGTTQALSGRLTMNIVDASNTPIPFAGVHMLGVPSRLGQYGAEIAGTAFTVTGLGEVQDPTTMAWTPYLDYYDAQQTPATGGPYATVDIDGAFYDE